MAKEELKKEETPEAETPATAEKAKPAFTMSDLRTGILNAAAAILAFGTFDPEPATDEKGNPVIDETTGKPVMIDGAAYAEVKSFAPFDALKELANKIVEQGGRGIPLETQLATAQAKLDAAYLSVPMVNGKPNMGDAGFRERVKAADKEVVRLESLIAREKAKAEAAKKAEAEKAKTPEPAK